MSQSRSGLMMMASWTRCTASLQRLVYLDGQQAVDAKGKILKKYLLPSGAHLMVEDGQGDVARTEGVRKLALALQSVPELCFEVSTEERSNEGSIRGDLPVDPWRVVPVATGWADRSTAGSTGTDA
jgi:hypothetical protein